MWMDPKATTKKSLLRDGRKEQELQGLGGDEEKDWWGGPDGRDQQIISGVCWEHRSKQRVSYIRREPFLTGGWQGGMQPQMVEEYIPSARPSGHEGI